MIIHALPKSMNAFVAVSAQCLAAATSHATSLKIKHNDAAAIAADHYDFVGTPGTDLDSAGKRGQLNQRRQELLAAQNARRAAFQAGRDFNTRALDHLKGFLGRT